MLPGGPDWGQRDHALLRVAGRWRGRGASASAAWGCWDFCWVGRGQFLGFGSTHAHILG